MIVSCFLTCCKYNAGNTCWFGEGGITLLDSYVAVQGVQLAGLCYCANYVEKKPKEVVNGDTGN